MLLCFQYFAEGLDVQIDMNYVLLFVVVLAWGFSWYAIVLQVAEASALVSLAYRFILASIAMCAGLVITRRWSTIASRDQIWVFALGFCLFSINFLCFYLAAPYFPSGLLSVIFALAAIFGAINAWIFFRKPIEVRVIVAATLGLIGLSLLLLPEIGRAQTSETPWWAFILPFAGTYLFSLGNIISARLSQSYSLHNIVGQGMVWGAVIILLLCLVLGETFTFPASLTFWGAVAFLALISSLLAFLTYLTLVNRVGTARASFATVLFPIVAMVVSALFEDFDWTLTAAIGLLMVLGGTYLTFGRQSQS